MMENKNKIKIESIKPITATFVIISGLFVACLLISNIVAGKLIQVWRFVLPGGSIIFPLTYIFGDILTEVYGFKRARMVIWIGFTANFLMVLLFLAIVKMPYPVYWENQEAYSIVLLMTPRIVGASLVAYFSGEYLNATILSLMKKWTKGKYLWTRTIGSTVVGEGVDTVMFIIIAFGGSYSWMIIGGLILTQYIWKVAYEIAITPLTYIIVSWVKKRDRSDVYDQGEKYNPFSLKIN